jgi:hypothetical protein
MQLKIASLPAGVTEAQIRQVFGKMGQVVSVKLSRDFGFVEMISPTVRQALDSTGIGEIRLGDVVKVDSSGLGELANVRISLA